MKTQTLIRISILIVMTVGRSDSNILDWFKSAHHFCDSFSGNNFTIDYSFDYMGKDIVGKTHYLVIGNRFWRLTTQRVPTPHDIKGEYELLIDPKVNGVSEWLGKDFKTGFTLWSDSLKTFISGMVSNDSNRFAIKLGIFQSSTLEEINLSFAENTSIIVESENSRPFPSMFSKTIGTKTVAFGNRTKGMRFRSQYIWCKLKGNTLQIERSQRNGTNFSFDQTVELITEFENSFRVRDYDILDYEFYVFAVNKSIKYCVNSDLTNETNCSSLSSVGELKTLIDCNDYPQKDHPMDWKYWALIGLIIIMVILVIAVCFAYRRRKQMKFIPKSSGTTLQSESTSKDSSTQKMTSQMSFKPSIAESQIKSSMAMSQSEIQDSQVSTEDN